MSPTDDFAKPAGSRMRRPEAMARGVEYVLTSLAKEKSKFQNRRTGEDIFKTLAIYNDYDMIFYTYLPYQYDNQPDSFFIDNNQAIKSGKNLRLVFYGKIGNSIEMELLFDGQEVNKRKLEGVAEIMKLEAGVDEEPASKRVKTD